MGFFSSNSLVNKEFCVDFVNKEIFSLLTTMNVLNSSINTFFSDSQQGLLIKIFDITKNIIPKLPGYMHGQIKLSE